MHKRCQRRAEKRRGQKGRRAKMNPQERWLLSSRETMIQYTTQTRETEKDPSYVTESIIDLYPCEYRNPRPYQRSPPLFVVVVPTPLPIQHREIEMLLVHRHNDWWSTFSFGRRQKRQSRSDFSWFQISKSLYIVTRERIKHQSGQRRSK